MISQIILDQIKEHTSMWHSEYHGIVHWKQVEKNGLYLCDFTGADKQVVSLFGYFHDCMRFDEGADKGHGLRSANYAKYHRDLLDITDDQFDSLYKACAGHTGGRKPANVTIATCWDADRLDIGRVGAIVKEKFLYSDEAKRIARGT